MWFCPWVSFWISGISNFSVIWEMGDSILLINCVLSSVWGVLKFRKNSGKDFYFVSLCNSFQGLTKQYWVHKRRCRQLRARRALSIFNDVPLRTRRVLLLYRAYGDSTLLVLNGTSLNCNNALLALNWWYVVISWGGGGGGGEIIGYSTPLPCEQKNPGSTPDSLEEYYRLCPSVSTEHLWILKFRNFDKIMVQA